MGGNPHSKWGIKFASIDHEGSLKQVDQVRIHKYVHGEEEESIFQFQV